MSNEAIRNYYRDCDEWGRLDTPAGQLEFFRCMSVLDDHLPDSARLLDIGGGPGRYAIELARRGHRVSLVDLCSHHIEIARGRLADRDLLRHVEVLSQGDACELDSFDEDTFDAVVAFGPFYHITDDDRRRRAASELVRVMRPEAVAFVQFIPPMSGLVRLLQRATELPRALTAESLEQAREELQYENPSDVGFQQAAYVTTDQLESLFGQFGCETVDMMSVFGLAAGREDMLCDIQARDPELYEAFSAVIEDTARRPEVIELGQLALWVGRLVAR